MKVLNSTVCGLLDSGAFASILGNNSHKSFINLGFKLIRMYNNNSIVTANGKNIKCIGYMNLPVNVDNNIKVINFYVVPSVQIPIIFGIDFWKKFEIDLGNKNVIFDKSINDNICSLEKVDGLHEYDTLEPYQKQQLDKLIQKFSNIDTEKVGLGRTSLITHKIDTGSAQPIKQRYYPLSPIKQEILEKELDKMLSQGVVEPSTSPWNSPVVMVQKQNGEVRLCLDSRKLNSVSKSDAYPMPYIPQILDQLRNARYLSSIDLSSSYWQIPFDSKESAEKTAFTVPRRGLFQYKVMCFGLVGASATMQRCMDSLFGPEFDNKVYCYQDDIIIIAENFNEHITLLNRVYEKLKYANFTINMKKSKFCRKELKYLGYLVDRHGLRTDPDKVKVILNYPTPKKPKDIKVFLGMAGWYRRFIKDFSKIARPLCKLTSKNTKFQWSEEAENSFTELKSALVSAPILKSPDFTKQFSIHTDASAYAIGAVLTQDHDGFDHPIAYLSRSLTKNEINYSTTERELLAVIFALEQFQRYIGGQKCNIITDHASLQWFYKLQNHSGRLARWSMRLSQYNFNIIHRKGKSHQLPDSLSRIPVDAIGTSINNSDVWYSDIVKKCIQSPHKYPNFRVNDNQLLRHCKNKYSLTSQYDWKIVVPKDEQLDIIKKFHDDTLGGHLGVMKTHRKIALHYYWLNMYKDIENYVSKCEICKQYKPTNQARPGLMGNPKQINRPFEGICLDLLGPFPRSSNSNTNILVCSDYFSKYVMLFPIRNTTANTIVKIVEKQIFLVHGVPKYIYQDNGPQFISKQYRDLLKKYNVPNVYYNPSYHPQVNQAERAIRNVVQTISCYVKDNHKKWDQHLSEVQCALNTAVNDTTKFTPYFLMHGREMCVDGTLHNTDHIPKSQVTVGDSNSHAGKLQELNNIFQKVKGYMQKVHVKNEKHYNLRKRNDEFSVGQIVYKRTFFQSNADKHFSAKLAPRFVKCIVSEKLSPLVYKLKSMEGKALGTFHIKDILKTE